MKTKYEHIVMGGAIGESAHCRRCGAGLRLSFPLPIKEFIAATGRFQKDHQKCGSAAGGVWKEPIPNNYLEWTLSRDVGVSSATILEATAGMASPCGQYGIPLDPSDFGRCYRLLELFPELRARLNRVVYFHPEWRPIIEAWDELTALWEEESAAGSAPKLFARLRELLS